MNHGNVLDYKIVLVVSVRDTGGALPVGAVRFKVNRLVTTRIPVRVAKCINVLVWVTLLGPGCGSGLVVHVEVDGTAPEDALPDASLNDAAHPVVQAIISPSLTELSCIRLDVVEGLDRVQASVCFPPGALDAPRTVTLSQVRDESTSAPGPVRGLAFRVAAPDTTLRQGDSYRPIARLEYASSAGLPANLALGQRFEDASPSALWRILKGRASEPGLGRFSGQLEEAPMRIGSGITFAPVLHCERAEQCPTNYCAAEVCQ